LFLEPGATPAEFLLFLASPTAFKSNGLIGHHARRDFFGFVVFSLSLFLFSSNNLAMADSQLTQRRMQQPSTMQRTRSQDLVPDDNHILDEDPLLISQTLTYVTDDGSVLHSFQSAPFSYGKNSTIRRFIKDKITRFHPVLQSFFTAFVALN
jgi:hypothetical protein